MKYVLDFHEGVADDSLEAYEWYENKRLGLGERFLETLTKMLHQIATNPATFGEKSQKGYREAGLYIFIYNCLQIL